MRYESVIGVEQRTFARIIRSCREAGLCTPSQPLTQLVLPAHISGGVHLVQERPDGGASSHGARSCRGVEDKTPACCVLGHGAYVAISMWRERRRGNDARVMFGKQGPLSRPRRSAISFD